MASTSTSDLLGPDLPPQEMEKKKEPETPFWITSPCILVSSLVFLPTESMSKNERLNALTRLVLIVTAVLYYCNFEHWMIFGLVAVLAIVLFKYGGKKDAREDFSITPTYASNNFQDVTVSPLFSEEWQIPPPAYDLAINEPQWDTFEMPRTMGGYPYSQYLTRTNLLPSDEQAIRMLNGGPRQARAYINDAWTRNTLGYRANIERLYKKSLLGALDKMYRIPRQPLAAIKLLEYFFNHLIEI